MDKKYCKALKETYMIFSNADDKIKKKIPKSFWNFLINNMDTTYFFVLQEGIPLENQPLMKETTALVSLIYRDYICSN